MPIVISVYDPNRTYTEQKKFDCENDVINRFVKNTLKKQNKQSLNTAMVLTDTDNKDCFVGFYTLAAHSISVELLSKMELGSMPAVIPCIRLIMLGIDKKYQGQKLGSMLMKSALQKTKDVASTVGNFGMYLDADPTAIGFYTKLGFVLLVGDLSPNTSPMFIPLASIA